MKNLVQNAENNDNNEQLVVVPKSPNPNFSTSWEKMGIFSILKIESLFTSFHILFSHFCPAPNPNFSVSWGKMRLDPSPH